MIKLTLSLIVLIITYFLIFTNRRIRTTSAFFGAILTIILGLITFDKAITYIDFNKLGIIIWNDDLYYNSKREWDISIFSSKSY